MKLIIKSPCSASVIIQYGIKRWPIWECEPSKFQWNYEEKETCLIIKGEAKIKIDNKILKISAGDLIIFPKGLTCYWEIIKPIKKHFRIGD